MIPKNDPILVPHMVQKVPETMNGPKRYQKWSKMVHKPGRHVQKCPRALEIHVPYYQARAVYIQIFVKCRFKGDTSQTSFRSLCKMALLAPRTGHISSYSCPFDLVPSRIGGLKCPLQNRVSIHFWLNPPQKKDPFFAKKKSPNTPQKVKEKRTKKARKWVQKDTKTTPKWCQNDP